MARTRATRADARRNIATILETGEACLDRNPDATMSEIAREAGIGRVTLYGHFPSRAELVEAVFVRVVDNAHEALDAVDLTGDPVGALRRLVAVSWRVVHRYRSVLTAAERELPPERLRGHHDKHRQRLSALLERGREAGAFRTDVPAGWLAAVCMTLMHTAAAEVMASRLSEEDADHAVIETIVSACRPPTGT